MIYTLTLNPAVDYFGELPALQSGSVNRLSSVRLYPGGKGINVSLVLSSLGIPNIALGFIGGVFGEWIIAELDKLEQKHDFCRIADDTRLNIKLHAGDMPGMTEINGLTSVRESELETLAAKIHSLINPRDTLIMSGSMPGGVPAEFYSEVCKNIKKITARVIIDTSGKSLSALKDLSRDERPFLIKPNADELGELFGTKIADKETAARYGRQALCFAENALVSLGEDGAVLITESGVLFANKKVSHVKSAVAAGDTLLAGFVAALEKGQNNERALKSAVELAAKSVGCDWLTNN